MRNPIVCLSLLLVACASTAPVPTHKAYQGDDAACIVATNFVNPVTFFKDGEAHVWLKEIDGLTTSEEGRVCLAPGIHRIGARGFNRREYSSVRFEFDLPPRSAYHLKAYKAGLSFHWRLYDNSANPPTEVLAVTTNITSADSPPTFVPIVIPKR